MLALGAGALALLVAAPADARQAREGSVTIVVVPNATTPEQLASIPGTAIGLISTGIGSTPPAQTYVDVTQGTRINNSLYPEDAPLLPVGAIYGINGERWARVVDRAEGAPSSLVPGLLGSTLSEAGIEVRAAPDAGNTAVMAADRLGRIQFDDCEGCPGLTVMTGHLDTVRRLVRDLPAGDLLIAFARPPSLQHRQLPIAVAGLGEGLLISDSTRLPGYVLSTDIAPTVLEHFGVDVPDEVVGRPMRAEGERDVADVIALADRMAVIPERRSDAVGLNLLIWLALTAVALAIWRRRALEFAFPVLAVSAAYLPAVLLACAALEPSAAVERTLAGAGSPALALLTIRLLGPWGALAVAAGISVGAHAVDVVVGSPLTSLSLLGPNPGLGVRFYGIGNELEATIGVLAFLGTGAALTAWGTRVSARGAAAIFAAVTVVAVMAFAPGRFGADVGAAIAFPAGGAAAVIVALGGGRRSIVALVVAAPIVALAGLLAADAVLGGDAHLSRSVLGADGLDDLRKVAERRLRLGAKSFVNYAESPALWVCLGLLVAGIVRRRQVIGWFSSPYARAGFAGAVAATLVGAVANDSSAFILITGTALTSLCAAQAWAVSGRA